MDYKFLNNSFDKEQIVLPNSDKIAPILLKNHNSELIKGLSFLSSEDKLLQIHGFLGTGKRQFINYITSFFSPEVVIFEYYCKKSTVCDDIILSFISELEKLSHPNLANNVKIMILSLKLKQLLENLHKPVILVLHSLSEMESENLNFLVSLIKDFLSFPNLKIIVSTRAMNLQELQDVKIDRKIFLKALTKENFKEYLLQNAIESTNDAIENFYKYTRGYYYYTILSVKIIQAMKISLNDFLTKFTMFGVSFDEFLGITYINLLPTTIQKFFWFLRTLRHGVSTNALSTFELYDAFAIEYLEKNFMIFQVNEMIYVQDYFTQDIDISIPQKTLIKLHKYIISIYEKQLKEPLQSRVLFLSRQSLRAEIDYHTKCIDNLENGKPVETKQITNQYHDAKILEEKQNIVCLEKDDSMLTLDKVKELEKNKKYTEAIELCLNLLNQENLSIMSLIEIRLELGHLYKIIEDYNKALHYFELVQTYYESSKQEINLNYLLYELADIYFHLYKNERAIETLKKVIYSVNSPRTLMVSACTMLGNIYVDTNKPQEAYIYYQKALQSLDNDVEDKILAELYFKYALANDDRNELNLAFEYYSKCISIKNDNPYLSLAYSNIASCYYENNNLEDAYDNFKKAYDIEKTNNNYEGIYYVSSKLAKICSILNKDKALEFYMESISGADFINEDYYRMESHIALGDFYYDDTQKTKETLIEYMKAMKIIKNMNVNVDLTMLEKRINDMKYRVNEDEFNEIKRKYE